MDQIPVETVETVEALETAEAVKTIEAVEAVEIAETQDIRPSCFAKDRKLDISPGAKTKEDAEGPRETVYLADTRNEGFFSGMLAYVPCFLDNTVYVVDVVASRSIAIIPVGNGPYAVDISPDGRFAFVSNFIDATLSAIRIADNRVAATIDLNQAPYAARGSEGVKASLDGQLVYVANYLSHNVSVVDVWHEQVISEIPLESGPAHIDTADGRLAYITLPDTGQTAVADFLVNLPVKYINIGKDPEEIRINRRSLALSTNRSSRDLTIVNTALVEKSGSPVPVGDAPTGIAFDPPCSKAYITNQLGGSVSVVDIFTHRQQSVIPVGNAPVGIDVTYDGRFTVAANSGDGTISIINNRIEKVQTVVPVGACPLFLKVVNGRL